MLDFKAILNRWPAGLRVTDNYILLSHSLKAVYVPKQDRKQQEQYLQASYTLPKKLLPKEYLLKLYIASKQHEKAEKMAINILDTPAKIPSNQADNIRRIAAKF